MDVTKKRTKHFVIVCILYSVGLIALTIYSNFIYNYRLPVVTFVLPEPGSIVEEGTEEEQYYGAVIPAEALQEDELGYYVLVVQKDESVLGYGYEARRRSVGLLDSDEKCCAVSGIAPDEQVIIEAGGDITDGSDVSVDDSKLPQDWKNTLKDFSIFKESLYLIALVVVLVIPRFMY